MLGYFGKIVLKLGLKNNDKKFVSTNAEKANKHKDMNNVRKRIDNDESHELEVCDLLGPGDLIRKFRMFTNADHIQLN